MKLTENQLRVLYYVAGATNAYDSCMSERYDVPAARGRDTFIASLRAAFDEALANGWIEPVTEYLLTEAGRAALQERSNG